MQIEVTKIDLGLIVVALSRYIRNHDAVKNTDKMSMKELALYFRDLSSAAKLCATLDDLFKQEDNLK